MDSDVRSKNHIKPIKINGADPGTYENSIDQFKKPSVLIGTAKRQGLEMNPKNPGPDAYEVPNKFNEGSKRYTFSQA
jgi:hypothetical protein